MKNTIYDKIRVLPVLSKAYYRDHLDLKRNLNQINNKPINTRSGSRTSAISKMGLFVTAVNGWKALLTIVTKSSILDVVKVIGLPPNAGVIAPFHETLYGKLFELYVNYLPYLYFSLQHFKIHVQTDNLKHEM